MGRMTELEKEIDSIIARHDIRGEGKYGLPRLDLKSETRRAIMQLIAQRDAALVERLEKEKRFDPRWPIDAEDVEFNAGIDKSIQLVNQQGDSDLDVPSKPFDGEKIMKLAKEIRASDSQEFVTDEEEGK